MSVKIIKRLLKQTGFSLLEITVTLGLMGLVSLFTMKVMEQQNMSQLSIEATAEINMTISTIAQSINDPIKCASMFRGKVLGQNLPGLTYRISKPGLPAEDYNLLETFANHNKVYQQFYIRDASSISVTGEPGSGTAILNILFHVQPLTRSQRMTLAMNPFARTIRRSIPFNVITDPATNVIQSCGPVISTHNNIARQNACSALAQIGARWNGTNCVILQQSCPYGQLVIGFNANGDILCEPASNQVKAEDIFDLGHVANCLTGGSQTWGLAVGGSGKIQLRCW